MTFLVDANVLSEATKPAPNLSVVDWLFRNERYLAVDPIIVGEIEFGILLLPSGRRRNRLRQWFESGVKRMRCLPWDAKPAHHWAELLATLRAASQAMPIKDSLIAATALTYGLTMATRNRRDCAKAGLDIVDPFA